MSKTWGESGTGLYNVSLILFDDLAYKISKLKEVNDTIIMN